MPSQDKIERVTALREQIEGSEALLLTEYRGLTVSEISDLRASLSEGGAHFAVVKNTLMRRAADDAGLAELGAILTGPSAVAFIDGDPVAAAKSVVEASKEHPALVLKGAWMEGKLLSAEEARSLADLDSREVMLSKIAGMLKSEMSRAAAAFAAAPAKFLSLLESYKAKVPSGTEPEATEPEATEPEATEPEATEPEATGDDSSDDNEKE
jgi:large subunit ribosomal protein L10